MITRETILDFFDHTRQLKREGRARFDIDQVCRWSFFFVDTDREKLTRAGRYVEQQGYEVAGFLEPTPEDDDQGTIYLRVDKVERHTPDSLLARNAELYKVAANFGLDGYDGMDVGAVDGP
jgi:Regulator of ribonuclease activity B